MQVRDTGIGTSQYLLPHVFDPFVQSERRLRLIALRGYGQEQDRERARVAGFDDHLLKPASMEALRRVLSRESPPDLRSGTSQ